MATDSTEEQEPRSGRRRRTLFIAGTALLVLFGASFAANIEINAGTEVEFGQGIEQILACDSEAAGAESPGVTVTLTSGEPAAVGSDGPLQFSIDGLIVSDIDALCAGKVLKVGLYENDGTLRDEITFLLDPDGLTGDPFRAIAVAGDDTVGCDPADPPILPDGSDFDDATDCFPTDEGPSDGLAPGIDAADVDYVALETSDPAA